MDTSGQYKSFFSSGFMYQVWLVPVNYTSGSITDGNSEGRQWQKMKEETGDETKDKFERRRG